MGTGSKYRNEPVIVDSTSW